MWLQRGFFKSCDNFSIRFMKGEGEIKEKKKEEVIFGKNNYKQKLYWERNKIYVLFMGLRLIFFFDVGYLQFRVKYSLGCLYIWGDLMNLIFKVGGCVYLGIKKVFKEFSIYWFELWGKVIFF